MSRNRKWKRQGIIFFWVALILLGAVIVGGLFVFKTMEASYKVEIAELEQKIDDNTKTFYVTTVDIKFGEIITQDKVRIETNLLGYPTDSFTADDIGSVAIVDVPVGTILLKPMCEAVVKEASEREVEYSCFYVGQNIVVGDYIDIRIRFQTGEDFVILPKKRVEKLSLSNATCFLMVNELEIQRMASAIVDVAEYDAVMYCNVYPQPEIQEAAETNYPARVEIDRLMKVLAERLGIEYVDSREERAGLETRLTIDTYEKVGVIDVSNLSGYLSNDKSNTNGNGTSISSDYTSTEEYLGSEQ